MMFHNKQTIFQVQCFISIRVVIVAEWSNSESVNTICWNDSGSSILSGSDDQHLVITDPFNAKVLLDFQSAHRANIFSAKFLPGTSDRQIVSCSADGMVFHTDVTTSTEHTSNGFSCHEGPVYEVLTVDNESHSFLTCGEDGNVRWFDLRAKRRCNESHCSENVIINARKAVLSMAVNRNMSFQLAIGCSDGFVRLYDRRMLTTGSSMSDEPRGLFGQFSAPSVGDRCHRITSVVFDEHGTDLLVSYSSDYIYLFSLQANCGKKLTAQQDNECADEKSTAASNKYVSSWNSSTRSRQPQMKRVRLRGDWSDTGPDARPERDRSQPDDSSATSVMQRMSEILTRWLEGSMQQADSEQSVEGEAHSDQLERTLESTDDVTNTTGSPDNAKSFGDVTSSSALGDCVERDNDVMETSEKLASVCSVAHSELHETVLAYGNDSLPNESCSKPYDVVVSESDAVSKTFHSLPFEAAIASSSRIDSSEMDVSVEAVENRKCSDVLHCSRDEVAETTGMDSDASATANTLCHSSDEPTASSSSSRRVSLLASSNESPSSTLQDTDDSFVSVTAVEHQKLPNHDGNTSIELFNTSAYEDEMADDIGRRMAAVKLQEIFRKRQARRQTEQRLESRATLLQVFRGHRNSRTMIKKATFWGTRYVMSGSDCGHIFIWDRHTCRVVKLLEGDRHVVNCLQPHPFHHVLASSGIDHDVKIWMPIDEEPTFDEVFTNELMQRNEIMLEETRDTVSVPATFMLRMLASMSRVRRERMRQHQQQPE